MFVIQTISVPKVNCAVGTATGVSDGQTVTTDLSVTQTLTLGAPFVAVVAAADEESKSVCILSLPVVGCVDSISYDLPVIRGLAPFLAFQPQYAPNSSTAAGFACLEDDYKTLENNGHCFDANFSTTVLSANYPTTDPPGIPTSPSTVTGAMLAQAAAEAAYLDQAFAKAEQEAEAAALAAQ